VYRIESKKFHVFLSSLFQRRAIRYRGTPKPGFVPPSRDHGMAKIAQSDYVFRDVGATLRAGRYVVCVKNAIRITGPVATNLTLQAIALLNHSSELLPMATRIVTHDFCLGEVQHQATSAAAARSVHVPEETSTNGRLPRSTRRR